MSDLFLPIIAGELGLVALLLTLLVGSEIWSTIAFRRMQSERSPEGPLGGLRFVEMPGMPGMPGNPDPTKLGENPTDKEGKEGKDGKDPEGTGSYLATGQYL